MYNHCINSIHINETGGEDAATILRKKPNFISWHIYPPLLLKMPTTLVVQKLCQ